MTYYECCEHCIFNPDKPNLCEDSGKHTQPCPEDDCMDGHYTREAEEGE